MFIQYVELMIEPAIILKFSGEQNSQQKILYTFFIIRIIYVL